MGGMLPQVDTVWFFLLTKLQARRQPPGGPSAQQYISDYKF